jgi:hypothetical protein
LRLTLTVRTGIKTRRSGWRRQSCCGAARRREIQALALTGSTARARRTRISDLDYHVVGPRLDLDGLPGDLDVVTDSEDEFFDRLRRGDDFAQWTVRLGCILLDKDGVMRCGAELMRRERLWPDPTDKLRRAPPLAELAEKVMRIGDREAGQEHLRAALTARARGVLLARHVFPLSRAELPGQLASIGETALARALDRAIHRELPLEELKEHLRLIGRSSSSAAQAASPSPE